MSIVKNITSADNLDWREIVINWEGMGDDVTEIKAGTPMDAEGNIANNGNCFGLMMGDVLRTRNRARVVISGPVDLDDAEENSGITLTDEAKAAMRDVWFPGKSGGGLPTGGAAYQQLVTDGEGNAKWEDRLAYDTVAEITYLDEMTLAFSAVNSNLNSSSISATLDISAGDTVIVTWDGVRYTCIADDTLGTLALGNMGIAGAGEDTGEPFVFFKESGIWMVATTDSSASHVVSVSGYDIVPKKIDAKYVDLSSVPALQEMPYGEWTYEKAKKILNSGKLPYMQMSMDWGAFIMFPCQDATGQSSTEYITFASFVSCDLMDYSGARVAYVKLIKGAGNVVGNNVKIYDLPRGDNGTDIIIKSSTSGSSKKFKITVDDSGTISATEV